MSYDIFRLMVYAYRVILVYESKIVEIECIRESIIIFTVRALPLRDGKENSIPLLHSHLGNVLCLKFSAQIVEVQDASWFQIGEPPL